MASFFKSFGKGILYFFAFPFCVIFLAIFGVIGIVATIYMFIKSIVLFFMGTSLDIELPEDKQAKEIYEQAKAMSNPAPVTQTSQPQQVIIQHQPNILIQTSDGTYKPASSQDLLIVQEQPQIINQEPEKIEIKPEQIEMEEKEAETFSDDEIDDILSGLAKQTEVIETQEEQPIQDIMSEESIYVPDTPKEVEIIEDEYYEDSDDDIDITYTK